LFAINDYNNNNTQLKSNESKLLTKIRTRVYCLRLTNENKAKIVLQGKEPRRLCSHRLRHNYKTKFSPHNKKNIGCVVCNTNFRTFYTIATMPLPKLSPGSTTAKEATTNGKRDTTKMILSIHDKMKFFIFHFNTSIFLFLFISTQ